MFVQWRCGHPLPATPDHCMADPKAPPTSISRLSLSGLGQTQWTLAACQLYASRGPPSPTAPSVSSRRSCQRHGASMLGNPKAISQSPFLTDDCTHLPDKLDFRRPVRTKRERSCAAEPQGQLRAVLQDLYEPGVSQGSIFQ